MCLVGVCGGGPGTVAEVTHWGVGTPPPPIYTIHMHTRESQAPAPKLTVADAPRLARHAHFLPLRLVLGDGLGQTKVQDLQRPVRLPFWVRWVSWGLVSGAGIGAPPPTPTPPSPPHNTRQTPPPHPTPKHATDLEPAVVRLEVAVDDRVPRQGLVVHVAERLGHLEGVLEQGFVGEGLAHVPREEGVAVHACFGGVW